MERKKLSSREQLFKIIPIFNKYGIKYSKDRSTEIFLVNEIYAMSITFFEGTEKYSGRFSFRPWLHYDSFAPSTWDFVNLGHNSQLELVEDSFDYDFDNINMELLETKIKRLVESWKNEQLPLAKQSIKTRIQKVWDLKKKLSPGEFAVKMLSERLLQQRSREGLDKLIKFDMIDGEDVYRIYEILEDETFLSQNIKDIFLF